RAEPPRVGLPEEARAVPRVDGMAVGARDLGERMLAVPEVVQRGRAGVTGEARLRPLARRERAVERPDLRLVAGLGVQRARAVARLAAALRLGARGVGEDGVRRPLEGSRLLVVAAAAELLPDVRRRLGRRGLRV